MPSTEVKQTPEFQKASLKQEAVERLIENGDLLRFNDLEVWHGRASFGEDWKIEPFHEYKESRNVYESMLYGTLHKEDAEAFAHKRARRHSEAEPALHQIVALSDSSLIFDGRGVNTLILPKEMVGSPKKYAQKQPWYSADLKPAILKLMEDRVSYIEIGEVQKVSRDLGVSIDALREYAAVLNGYFSLTHAPVGKSVGQMLYNRDFFQLRQSNRTEVIETSPDYTRDVLRQNHIIGSKDRMRSGTLRKSIDDVIVIWDFDAVQDKEVYKKQKKQLGHASMSAS